VTHGHRRWWAARPTTATAPRADRGSATAELAVGLPALVLLTVVAVTAVGAVLTQLRCVDAAREAARAQARGEPGVIVAERVAPPGAAVGIELADGTVRATVRVQVHPLGGRLPGFEVSAVSVAALEPTAAYRPGTGP
jgi:TadE-like protein